jgi:hypothetical protein
MFDYRHNRQILRRNDSRDQRGYPSGAVMLRTRHGRGISQRNAAPNRIGMTGILAKLGGTGNSFAGPRVATRWSRFYLRSYPMLTCAAVRSGSGGSRSTSLGLTGHGMPYSCRGFPFLVVETLVQPLFAQKA